MITVDDLLDDLKAIGDGRAAVNPATFYRIARHLNSRIEKSAGVESMAVYVHDGRVELVSDPDAPVDYLRRIP